MNDFSSLEKTPLSYKREKQDCKYTTIDACTNSCEMYETVDIKAVLQSISEPETVQYGGREMIIQKGVAADKSGAMGITFYSQLVDRVEEGKSYIWPISRYIPIRIRDTSKQLPTLPSCYSRNQS